MLHQPTLILANGNHCTQRSTPTIPLQVLHALSSTDDMLKPIAAHPGCLSSINYYLGSSNTTKIGLQLTLAAANVLVNLTYSGSNAMVQQVMPIDFP